MQIRVRFARGGCGARRGRFYLPSDDGERELVATRSVSVDGRSRATIDGSMASASELAKKIAPSVDLCGQHEHQRLMKPASHGPLLDAWAADEVEKPLGEYRRAYAQAVEAQRDYDRVREARALLRLLSMRLDSRCAKSTVWA